MMSSQQIFIYFQLHTADKPDKFAESMDLKLANYSDPFVEEFKRSDVTGMVKSIDWNYPCKPASFNRVRYILYTNIHKLIRIEFKFKSTAHDGLMRRSSIYK